MTLFAFPAGTVTPYASPYASLPKGWVKCDGSLYDGTLESFSTLFTAIGLTYGGSGTSFRVPNLGQRIIRCGTLGYFDGASKITLTSATSGVGSHSHSQTNGAHSNHPMDEKEHNHVFYYGFAQNYTKAGGTNIGILDGANDDSGFVSTAYSGIGGQTVAYNDPNTDSAVCPANDDYSGTSTETGAAAQHENRMPYIAMQYLIKL